MKKITMNELAKTAGVSTTSVARYLKNEKVRADIADKVKKAIEITGFQMEEQPKEQIQSNETVPSNIETVVDEPDKKLNQPEAVESKKEKATKDVSVKFKEVLGNTSKIVGSTKAKLAKSGENLKKNMADSDFSGKLKKTLGKTGEKITETKNKVMNATVKTKPSAKQTEPLEVPSPVVEKKAKEIVKKEAPKKRVILEKKNYKFAILTKDATNPRSRKTIKAIQSVCYDYDCLFSIFVGEGNAVLEEKYGDMILAQKVDALIIESCANPDGLAKQFAKANMPCIFLNNKAKGAITLAVDEEKAGEVLGTYLMEMRHLIIRYLGADEALSTAHYEGIKKVYHERRQPLDFAIKMSDGSYLDVYDKLKEMFEEKIDLIILERDEMAIPLNKYLKEYHIAVPQNASVISFGGHAITRVLSPSLASLAFDYNTYAEFVLETVFATLEGKTKPKMPEIYHIQDGDSVR